MTVAAHKDLDGGMYKDWMIETATLIEDEWTLNGVVVELTVYDEYTDETMDGVSESRALADLNGMVRMLAEERLEVVDYTVNGTTVTAYAKR